VLKLGSQRVVGAYSEGIEKSRGGLLSRNLKNWEGRGEEGWQKKPCRRNKSSVHSPHGTGVGSKKGCCGWHLERKGGEGILGRDEGGEEGIVPIAQHLQFWGFGGRKGEDDP